jgi:thiol:disulfide interchange protein DsbD
MKTLHLRQYFVLAAAVCIASAAANAQSGGVKIETAWTPGADGVHPGTTIPVALDVKLEEGFHVQSNKPLDQFLIPTILTLTPPTGFSVKEIAYPEPIMVRVLDQDLSVFEAHFALGALIEVAPDTAPGAYVIPASLKYQACDDEKCLPPKTLKLEVPVNVVAAGAVVTPSTAPIFSKLKFSGVADETPRPVDTVESVAPVESVDVLALLDKFDILATEGGYLESPKFLAFIDRAETGQKKEGWFDNKGPLAILGLILLGGLALNLTPCVLPIIPINLAIIGAGAKAGSRGRGFALGGTYGLAMAIVYGALGLIVVLTSSAFGAINSTIWFNVGIAVLFVVLGLAMFDVITIDFSRFQTKFNLGNAKQGSFLLAFGMGGISALLAGACVAPAVIQVIVYSADEYAKGNELALTLPFFLGLGMALPWPFAGAGLSFLPKPGAWMVRIKQAMGVFILGFAAYYAYLAYEIYDSRNVNPDEVASAVEEQLAEGGWTRSLSGGLQQAVAEDKLVLVDMWATWCKSCLTMDKTTLKDPAVLARLEGYVKVKYQAEELEESPAKDVHNRFDGVGLPHYAILRPKK